jgi:hypothetical protein
VVLVALVLRIALVVLVALVLRIALVVLVALVPLCHSKMNL